MAAGIGKKTRLTLIWHFAPHILEKNYGIAPSHGTAPPFGWGKNIPGCTALSDKTGVNSQSHSRWGVPHCNLRPP